MLRSVTFVISLAAIAQAANLVSDGVYTRQQAERGKVSYAKQCSSCHGANLDGGDEAPALKGKMFLQNWGSHSVGEFSEKIQTTMPADKPGSLAAPENTDIVAFIFDANSFPAGKNELSAQPADLKEIRIDAPSAGNTPRPAARNNPAPRADPAPAMVEGQPIETRPPEKSDDKPSFPEQTRAPYHATAPYKITTLIDTLPAPWSLAFLPDGKILLTERLPGSLRILDKSAGLSEAISGVNALSSPGAKDIGMLDVVLDPKFAENHRIFFCFFDYIDGTDSNTNVARATLDEGKLALRDAKVIFRAQPAIPSKRLGGKTGGRIAIAPDGSLFVTIGDRSDSPPWDVAQRLDTDLGKIIHITADGAPSPDNPFIGKPGVLPEIWAYGTRSQEGLAFDPKTGELWEHEHGPRGGDELNIIKKGKNYGWPVIVHGIDYPGTVIGGGIVQKEGMEDPVYYWDPVIAPSGFAFYTDTLFPEWDGSVFVGALRGTMLTRLKIVNDKVVAEEPLLADLHARIRDVRVGPDGAVYVLTDSGTAKMTPQTPSTSKLLKLTPK